MTNDNNRDETTRRAFLQAGLTAGLSIALAPSLANGEPGAVLARENSDREPENSSAVDSSENSPPVARWDFTKWGDTGGWSFSPGVSGMVMGGSLWIKIDPAPMNALGLDAARYQIYGGRDQQVFDLSSPAGLGIECKTIRNVRVRLINLSPITDAFILWKTREEPEKLQGPARFTFDAERKDWQLATCDVDLMWTGTLDQLVIRFPQSSIRGDFWIEWVELTDGPPRRWPRPDLVSDRVVPKIDLPGIEQSDFHDAFRVLDEALVVHVPVFGFPHPVFGPGGVYGENWWQLDASLSVAGAKWANWELCENIVRGFRTVQLENPNGRIDLYGGSAIRGQVGDISSVPRFFEAGYDIARRAQNKDLTETIYLTMASYLDWWLSPVKRDARSGLITAVFEESLGEEHDYLGEEYPGEMIPQTLAPVDTNVAVAIGCRYTADLAYYLGHAQQESKYLRVFDELKAAINQYLWDEKKGAYYNYDVKTMQPRSRLICSTFDPMRLRIAPQERFVRLVNLLVDPAQFGWGQVPVTSLAKTDPGYVEATGTYDGRAWFGDVWTMRNMEVITGLEECGRHDLAGELTWSTVKAFNGSYHEFLVPSTGSGQGVRRYVWSASQYIQAIVEHLFGVDPDRLRGRLRVVPRIPAELYGKPLTLSNLLLPPKGVGKLSLRVQQEKPGKAKIAIDISGQLPDGQLEVMLPQTNGRTHQVLDARGRSLALVGRCEDCDGIAGVRLPMGKSTELHFE